MCRGEAILLHHTPLLGKIMSSSVLLLKSPWILKFPLEFCTCSSPLLLLLSHYSSRFSSVQLLLTDSLFFLLHHQPPYLLYDLFQFLCWLTLFMKYARLQLLFLCGLKFPLCYRIQFCGPITELLLNYLL
jgi:hypothetical protein